MVLGDNGRRVLVPMTLVQKFAAFPWKRFYNHSMYFRSLTRVSAVVLAGWVYILGVKGVDVWFTPYNSVHHSLGHNFAHWLDHERYPVEAHHNNDNKKH